MWTLGQWFSPQTAERITETVGAEPEISRRSFTPNPDALLARADRVVSMGRYNNVCELLASKKKARVVPRVTPRRAQWIRAERLQRLGAIDVCHPDELSPEAVSHWLARPRSRPTDEIHIDLDGLQRIPTLVQEALGQVGEVIA